MYVAFSFALVEGRLELIFSAAPASIPIPSCPVGAPRRNDDEHQERLCCYTYGYNCAKERRGQGRCEDEGRYRESEARVSCLPGLRMRLN